MNNIYFLFFIFIFFSCRNGEVREYQTYLNHNDTVKYVGKEECKKCHVDIYNSYIQTGMGQSFNYAVKENSALVDGKMDLIHDSIKNLTYKPFWKNDSLYLMEFRLSNNLDTIHKLLKKITYKIGSGHHTNSHLFNVNGYVYQAPYTYYTQDKICSFPPGYEDDKNSRFDRKIGLECMSCHNAHSNHTEGSLNKYDMVPQGIDCERCHGPGELHVKEKLAGNIVDTSRYIDYSIVNPKDLDVNLQFDVCQRCHLQGTAILNESYDFHDFKPGMHLKEIMDVYVPSYENKDMLIMASHAERLKESECFKKSEITCISCHDPHKSVRSLDENYFNNKCMSCHSTCDDDKNVNNCTQCHMPNSTSTDIMHVRITDHNIRVVKDRDLENRGKFLGLISVNNDNPTNLSKAKAYLKHFESFVSDTIYLDSAYYYLKNSSNNYTSYVQYFYLRNDLNGLVNYTMNRNIDTSKYNLSDLSLSFSRIASAYDDQNLYNTSNMYFKESIKLSPYITDYSIKYGVSLIKQKKFEQAKKIFKKVLALNPTVKESHLNLGYLSYLDNNYNEAEIYLKQALALDPDYLLAYENLLLLAYSSNKKEKIDLYIKKILEIDPKHKIIKLLS